MGCGILVTTYNMITHTQKVRTLALTTFNTNAIWSHFSKTFFPELSRYSQIIYLNGFSFFLSDDAGSVPFYFFKQKSHSWRSEKFTLVAIDLVLCQCIFKRSKDKLFSYSVTHSILLLSSLFNEYKYFSEIMGGRADNEMDPGTGVGCHGSGWGSYDSGKDVQKSSHPGSSPQQTRTYCDPC